MVKRILIRCPSTKKLQVTGITIEEETLDTYRFKENTVECPHCSQVHTWTKKDAVLAR